MFETQTLLCLLTCFPAGRDLSAFVYLDAGLSACVKEKTLCSTCVAHLWVIGSLVLCAHTRTRQTFHTH